MNEPKLDQQFMSSLYLYHINQDQAVGLRDSSHFTGTILQYTKDKTKVMFEELAELITESHSLIEMISRNRKQVNILTKKANDFKGRGKKKFVNKCLREAQELFDAAEDANKRLEEINEAVKNYG